MKGNGWVILVSCAFFISALTGLWGSGGFGLVSMLLSLLLGLICLVVGVRKLLKLNRPISLVPAIIALLPLLTVSTILFRVDAHVVEMFKGRVVFKGTCEHTVTFVHLVLREDGMCEFEPGSFLDRNWQSGVWGRSGDTIRVGVDATGNAKPTYMLLLITEEGLREVASDSAHAHMFSGYTSGLN